MGALPPFLVAAGLPNTYAFPMVAVLVHCLFLQAIAFKVGFARRRLNKPYPIVCDPPPASKEEPKSLFNCYVRAASNILENLGIYLCLLGMSSICTPVASAAAGLLYTASRYVYFEGYTTGDPAKRTRGNFGCTCCAVGRFSCCLLLPAVLKRGTEDLELVCRFCGSVY